MRTRAGQGLLVAAALVAAAGGRHWAYCDADVPGGLDRGVLLAGVLAVVLLAAHALRSDDTVSRVGTAVAGGLTVVVLVGGPLGGVGASLTGAGAAVALAVALARGPARTTAAVLAQSLGAGLVVLTLAAGRAWQTGLVLHRDEESIDWLSLSIYAGLVAPVALLVAVTRPSSRALPWLGGAAVGALTLVAVAGPWYANTVNYVGCSPDGSMVSTLVGYDPTPWFDAAVLVAAVALAGAFVLAWHRTGGVAPRALLLATLVAAVPASVLALTRATAPEWPHVAVAAWTLTLAGAALLAAGERPPPVASAPCASASRS
ncbi:hypothetical protein [Nocardioides marinquilinus]|uniref:hypothetical protein n=1 Tax=Nocardioides marinquilinus TaxID=1210400 RepID=UPI0031EABF6D